MNDQKHRDRMQSWEALPEPKMSWEVFKRLVQSMTPTEALEKWRKAENKRRTR
jgi:hypothetical protein